MSSIRTFRNTSFIGAVSSIVVSTQNWIWAFHIGSVLDCDTLGLIHTFRFSTGRQVPIIAGHSSETQESIGVFTQPGRFAGREFTSRLAPGAIHYSAQSPAGWWVISCTCVDYRQGSHAPVFTRLYPSDNFPLQCQ